MSSRERDQLEQLTLLARLAKQVRAFKSFKSYPYAVEEVVSVSRQDEVIAERDEYLTAIKTRLPVSRYEPPVSVVFETR